LWRHDASIRGSLLDAFVVNASAVVFDFDVDMVAAMISAQGDATGLGLAREGAALRKFDAMRDGVANEMDERVGNLLNDVVVEFGLAAEEVEFHEFGGGAGGGANGGGKARVKR